MIDQRNSQPIKVIRKKAELKLAAKQKASMVLGCF